MIAKEIMIVKFIFEFDAVAMNFHAEGVARYTYPELVDASVVFENGERLERQEHIFSSMAWKYDSRHDKLTVPSARLFPSDVDQDIRKAMFTEIKDTLKRQVADHILGRVTEVVGSIK